ncbi:hypothetical protein AMJ48_00980 [Parcubacteria bacterium DG_74_1]|nr:MAG: hypothetical protein AMJ48_00980 [Parcubacteria bacterium DG_74_1]
MHLGIAGIFVAVGLLALCIFAISEAMILLRKQKPCRVAGNWYGAVIVSTGYKEVEEITANARSRGCIVGIPLNPSETREFLGLEKNCPINTECALVPVWLPKGLTISEATGSKLLLLDKPKAVAVSSLKIDQFRKGDQLTIGCNGEPTFIALIIDPQKGQAIVRPAVTGQQGAGYRDAKSTLGSRSFHEGNKTHVSEETDPEIKWGELVFGDEFVLRNEDSLFGAEGRIFYTARQITDVSVPPESFVSSSM